MKKNLWIITLLALAELRFSLPVFFSQTQKSEYDSQLWTLLSLVNSHQESCKKSWLSCVSLPYQERQSDRYRLQTVQYAGSTRLEPPVFFWLLQKTLVLSPHQPFVYFFGSLLLPFWKTDHWISASTAKQSRNLAIKLWELAISNTCNREKISLINQISSSNLSSIKNNFLVQNPCLRYQNANLLWFHYSYFLQNTILAIKNYTIASAHKNIPLLLLDLPTKLAERQLEEARKK